MLELETGTTVPTLPEVETFRPTFRQLDLFGGFGILVIPSANPIEEVWRQIDYSVSPSIPAHYSTVIGFPMGPAPISCDQCGIFDPETYPVRNPSGEWVSPCCRYYCEGCSHYEDSGCSNCYQCDDCCSCSFCRGCEEMTSEDSYCSSCSRCDSCCECYHCSDCGDAFNFEDSSCPEANHCNYCVRRGYCSCECECSDCQIAREEDECYSERSNHSEGMTTGNGSVGTRIGLEIEFIGNRRDVYRYLSEHYEGTFRIGNSDTYSTARNDAWIVKPDGSVFDGGELVSPPMGWNDATRTEIAHILDLLRRAGCRVNDTTGLHVHVEARMADGTDFTAEQVRNVALLAACNEDALYRIASATTGKIRSGATSYCRPFYATEIDRLRNAKSVSDLLSATNGDRYKGCNLQSFAKYGTVEFRYCNGTLDTERMIAQIALFCSFRTLVQNGFTVGDDLLAYVQGCNWNGSADADTELRQLQYCVRTGNAMEIDDWNVLVATSWKDSANQAPIGRGF